MKEELDHIIGLLNHIVSILELTYVDSPDDFDYTLIDMCDIEDKRADGWQIFRFDDYQTVYMRRKRKL